MNIALLWNFSRQELVDRYAGSALGFTWAFLQPLVTLFIFVVIFGQVMGARLPGYSGTYGYSIYLVSGMLPWLAFGNTLARTASVFQDKKAILTKVGLSLPVLPIFIVIAESITFAISLVFFVFFLFLVGELPKPELVILPWVFLGHQMLALGLGLIFAVLNVFLRDVREFVAILVQIWFWLTPIVWTPQILSSQRYDLLAALNPMIPFISTYHAMFVPGLAINYDALTRQVVFAGIVLGLAYVAVRRMEKDVRDFL